VTFSIRFWTAFFCLGSHVNARFDSPKKNWRCELMPARTVRSAGSFTGFVAHELILLGDKTANF